MNFFSSALRKGMEERRFNQAQLAEFLKVDPAYVSRWLKGAHPRIDQMSRVLTALGWDLDRAHPDYDPVADALTRVSQDPTGVDSGAVKEAAADYGAPASLKRVLEKASRRAADAKSGVIFAGRVDASNGSVKFEEFELPVPNFLSPAFSTMLTDKEDIVLFLLEGSGLAPHFQDGTWLFAQQVNSISELKTGDDVMFKTGAKGKNCDLRRFVRMTNASSGRTEVIVGAPLTMHGSYLTCKVREAKCPYKIVGTFRQRD
ncbi:helix-turn-helix domain-containing protein [bacterium]|nr:helix-turn-helix domain-containing protein [bacterium]